MNILKRISSRFTKVALGLPILDYNFITMDHYQSYNPCASAGSTLLIWPGQWAPVSYRILIGCQGLVFQQQERSGCGEICEVAKLQFHRATMTHMISYVT